MSALPIFVCYRQSDGKSAAELIYEILNGHSVSYSDNDGVLKEQTLDVYFDQTAPGVSDWTEVHEPYLKRAKTFIVVCTPGAKIREGKEDWVYREISWWLENRPTSPILVDALSQGSRYVPDPILQKWPNAQRLTLPENGDEEHTKKAKLTLRTRIIDTLIPSTYLIYQQELNNEKERALELEAALYKQTILTSRIKVAFILSSILFLAAVTTMFFYYKQTVIAEEQTKLAENNFNASISIVDRITNRFLVESLHSSGYPGKEVAQMLQGVADDLSAIDPQRDYPDVQILQYRILEGFRFQNQYLGEKLDETQSVIECSKIISKLAANYPEKILLINPFSCISQTLSAIRFGRHPLLKEQGTLVCQIDHKKFLDDIIKVVQISFAENQEMTRKFAAELVKSLEMKDFPDLFACEEFMALDKTSTIQKLVSIIGS